MPTVSNTTVPPQVLEGRNVVFGAPGDEVEVEVDFADIIQTLSNSTVDTLTLMNVEVTDDHGMLDSDKVEQPRFSLKKLTLHGVSEFGSQTGFLYYLLSLFNKIDEIIFVPTADIMENLKDPAIPEADMEPWPPRLTSTPGGNTHITKVTFYGNLPPAALPGDEARMYWTTVYHEMRSALHRGSLVEFVTIGNIYPFIDDRRTLEHLTFSPRNYDLISRGAQLVISPHELWLLEGFSSLKTLSLYNVAVPLARPENATLESHTNALTNALLSVGYMLPRAPHQTLESVSVYLGYPIHALEPCPKYRLGDSGFWATVKHLLQSVVCQEQFQTFRIVLPLECPSPEETKEFLYAKLATGDYVGKFEVVRAQRAQ